MVLKLMLGNINYSFNTVINSLIGKEFSGIAFTINTLRLPRMLLGMLCGFAFGIAGNTFQKLLGNPLASPDVIGVTSGASLVAVTSILVLNISGNVVSLFAISGGILTALLIFYFARGNSVMNTRIVIVGIGIQALCHALTSLLLSRASQYDIGGALRWLSGSLNNANMTTVMLMLPVVIITSAILIFKSNEIKILELGDEMAIGLGVNVVKSKLVIFVTALVLVSIGVFGAGPITSVGFLAGPLTHRLLKENHPNLLQSGMMGIIIVLMSDLVAQNLLVTNYPVGIITGLLAAPYLIMLLVRISDKGR